MKNKETKHELRRYITIGFLAFLALMVVVSVVVLLSSYFPSGSEENAITEASCEGDFSACEESYKIWIFSLNQRVFEWSLLSGKMIFWLSVMVTASGLVLSFWQFWEASNVIRQSEEGELRLSSEGFSVAFKFKSIGAVILLLSVAYLSIYAKFIYPIDIVNIWPSQSQSETDEPLNVYSDGMEKDDEDPIRPENK